MSVTGTTTFNQTLYQVVQNAFAILNVYGIGRTFSPEDYQLAVSMVNMMVKSWGTQGLHLWCKEEGVLYLQQYQGRYGFGNSSSIGLIPAYATLASSAQITQTTSSINAGQTSINVLNSTNFTVGAYLGLVQSDQSLFWTTVAAIPNSTTITVALGPTLSINSAANVYSFMTKLNKPYRVISCRMVSGFDAGATSSINEIMMNPLSHADYFDLPVKSVNGLPNQYYYDPQLDYGVLNFWVRPNDCSYRVHFTFERIIDDITNVSDNFDFPVEWLEPLTWQLALRLSLPFAKDKKYPMLKEMAGQMLGNLLDWDKEFTGVSFQPDRDGGGIY